LSWVAPSPIWVADAKTAADTGRGAVVLAGWAPGGVFEFIDGEPLSDQDPLAEWQETRRCFRCFCQLVGKIQLAASVRLNHRWNGPCRFTAEASTKPAA
jgi:hypothetical protein